MLQKNRNPDGKTTSRYDTNVGPDDREEPRGEQGVRHYLDGRAQGAGRRRAPHPMLRKSRRQEYPFSLSVSLDG